MRKSGLFLALLLGIAPALAADVGFKLPNGARSRANTARGYVIRQDALPWGPDGNTVQPGFAQLAALRYGGTFAPDTPAPDVSGLHVTDYEAALIMIAAKDPEWCRSVGGAPCHPGQPTQQESHDAQYWSFGSRVIQRARELGLAEGPRTDEKIPVTLTGPDAGNPGESLAYGVSGCDPLRWRWSAPGAFVKGRGNAVTVEFPREGVYTVSVIGAGGNCGQAAMDVTIGDIPTPPPPPPPDSGDGGDGSDGNPDNPGGGEGNGGGETGGPPEASCTKLLEDLEPLLRQMLQVIESAGTPGEPGEPEPPGAP